MSLSTNAAAFSIDALLGGRDDAGSNPSIKSSDTFPILDAALTQPFSQLRLHCGELGSSRHTLQTVVPSPQIHHDHAAAINPHPSDNIPASIIKSSHAHAKFPIPHGLHCVSLTNNAKPSTPPIDAAAAAAKIVPKKSYLLEHQLTIPSFKIQDPSGNQDNVSDLAPDSPSLHRNHKPYGYRRHSSLIPFTHQMELGDDPEDDPTVRRRHSLASARERPLAVDRWVRSTLKFTPQPEADWCPIMPSDGPTITAPLSQIVDGIKVSLINADLWRKFDRCGTEMILNRAGRRMFPSVLISIEGLDNDALYSIRLHIVPADDKRYKFINCQWMPVGKADHETATFSHFQHMDSPSTGTHWMKGNVSFSKLKITNNKENCDSNIVLNSMHKYTPRIVIVREGDGSNAISRCFTFPETTFIAVTAYQNENITQLKIQNNPFAKAFRDADVAAALLQGVCRNYGSSPDPAFGDGYSQHGPRRCSSPVPSYGKIAGSLVSSEIRRRSLPTRPYTKPQSSYLRPPPPDFSPQGLRYNISERPCYLRRGDADRGSCSSISSVSQESGFGDYPYATFDYLNQVQLTKSKSTAEMYVSSETPVKRFSSSSSSNNNSITDLVSSNIPPPTNLSASLSEGDIHWALSRSSRIPPRHLRSFPTSGGGGGGSGGGSGGGTAVHLLPAALISNSCNHGNSDFSASSVLNLSIPQKR